VTPEIVLPVVGGVLGALLVFFGAYNTARVAKYSNDRTTSLEEFKVQLKARDDLIAGYKDDVKTLSFKVDALALRLETIQQTERMLYWWGRAVYPIVKESGKHYPTPPPGISDTIPR
jgi:hypothetical protein